MTTRFLLACISAFFYDGENTLEDLHEAIAEDASKLFCEGCTAPRLQASFDIV